MEDLKQAYESLGLPETATKEELENRYYLLMRRARSQKMRENPDSAAETAVDIDKISEAYRFIRDYEENQAKAEFTAQEYGKFKGMAEKAQKWDHFFHYYKFHLLIGIVVLVAIGFGIKAYVDHREEQERLAKLPPIDLSVMFYGEYYYGEGFGSDTDPLGEAILSQFPDWKRVKADLNYVPSEIRSSQDTALLEKSVIILIDNKSDLFLVDKANFEKLAAQDFFLPLDTYAGAGAGELPKAGDPRALSMKTEDGDAEHVYGIDLSNTPLGRQLGVNGSKEFIAGIKVTAARPEQATKFILHYLNEAK
ncbi:J domain-containing protein [Cohnella sp. AR92]|uniref:J domain-containing protein n=1 Tax=Cohnella sp. AR92 TaxID=648716 RepID=UPI000F8C8EBA|nr:J domain-containing protein [Cohnella sp. AR92]RUS45383.1 J domain-containing protein [Cohnella sp. AR92]